MGSDSFTLGDILTPPEMQALYRVYQEGGITPHKAMVAWCNDRPHVLAKLKEKGLLLDYFAYVAEAVFMQADDTSVPPEPGQN